jgi:PEP-CTERM motif
MKSFWKSQIGIVAAALLLAAAPAWATLFTLDEWDVSQFEAAGAYVTVNETFDGTNTTLLVVFHQGTLVNTLLGLDKFGYDSSVNCCVAGSTAGWSFTSGGTEDGFGSFLRTDMIPAGTDLTLTFILAGDLTGILTSADDFVGHARFVANPGTDSCSGFFGGEEVATTSEIGCGVRQTIPEPATLLLLGIGLVGAAVGMRRKRG